ncbi:MAG: HNH endonuclease [Thermomonas sp.]|uniref:HNH endonuclease n=1 Tax=Thermomonas sp. TaxID=1971895 RepID=UPI002608633C|nr:HNH endonuclease [Thermomonas sp.]MCC7096043.1 HNH endonuclease [Thermomonas sp.]
METDSATVRPVHAGARSAASLADGLASLDGFAETRAARLPGLRLLGLDAHGRALDWLSWQDATCLYARDAVAWTLGEPCLSIHGGISRASGAQSLIRLHPIIAARGHARPGALDPTPALTNPALFARDQHLCLYCGRQFHGNSLTRDHVHPISKGGRDVWENVVSACFHCNSHKGNRTPQQAGMPLLAVPYRPSWIEHLILSNRNILADQMAFLKAQLPKNPRRHG